MSARDAEWYTEARNRLAWGEPPREVQAYLREQKVDAGRIGDFFEAELPVWRDDQRAQGRRDLAIGGAIMLGGALLVAIPGLAIGGTIDAGSARGAGRMLVFGAGIMCYGLYRAWNGFDRIRGLDALARLD